MAGDDPTSWVDALRRDILPVASAFVVWVLMLVAFHRSRRAGAGRPRSSPAGEPGLRHLIRYVVATAAGGYAFFLAIVLVFYLVLGGEPERLVRQALVEGSVLAFAVVVPAFVVMSMVADRLRRPPRPGADRRQIVK